MLCVWKKKLDEEEEIMKCPFRKRITTTIEYGTSWPKEEKPKSIVREEEFCDCECGCRAYDGGICRMMKGSK